MAARRPDPDKLNWLGAGLGPLVARPRSRYILAGEKRKVIAKYERNTG